MTGSGEDETVPATGSGGSEPLAVAGSGQGEPVMASGSGEGEPLAVAGSGTGEPVMASGPGEGEPGAVTGPGADEVGAVTGPGGGAGSHDATGGTTEPPPGEGIVRAAVVGTASFVVVAVAAAVSRPVFSTAAVVVSLGLFAVGCVTFLWAYAVAVQRSRVDAIGMGGLFFLQGTAPARVQRPLLGAVVVQVVVAFATAAAHPFTSQAFVILVPMYGLGLSGLWGAKHGTFAPREERAAR